MAIKKDPSPITDHRSLAYFPGCALKDQAKGYEEGALAALRALGYAVQELPRWNCCGTVYGLAQDELVRHVGPVRNLIRAQEVGAKRLLTLCAMCFGTLKRSSRFVTEDPERLRRLHAFMNEEPDYAGGVEVFHLLTLLRDEVGYERLEEAVRRPLAGLQVAAYYGCMLLRPRDVGVDHPDRPEVMERVVAALGASPVEFPERVECCGAYLTVSRPEVVADRVRRIWASALRAGANLILTSCPLCHFNLERRRPADLAPIPIVYLGEVLAWALTEEYPLPAQVKALLAAEVKA